MEITNIVALLGAMSLSVERVVEIIKNILPWLAEKQSTPRKENYRLAALHFIAAIVGAVIAWVAQEQIQPLFIGIFKIPGTIGFSGCCIIGLLASGGSGFWNQCLSIVEEINNTKQLHSQVLQQQAKALQQQVQ
jgi:hypothetical protein